jgi:hypothetical protein
VAMGWLSLARIRRRTEVRCTPRSYCQAAGYSGWPFLGSPPPRWDRWSGSGGPFSGGGGLSLFETGLFIVIVGSQATNAQPHLRVPGPADGRSLLSLFPLGRMAIGPSYEPIFRLEAI